MKSLFSITCFVGGTLRLRINNKIFSKLHFQAVDNGTQCFPYEYTLRLPVKRSVSFTYFYDLIEITSSLVLTRLVIK